MSIVAAHVVHDAHKAGVAWVLGSATEIVSHNVLECQHLFWVDLVLLAQTGHFCQRREQKDAHGADILAFDCILDLVLEFLWCSLLDCVGQGQHDFCQLLREPFGPTQHCIAKVLIGHVCRFVELMQCPTARTA